MTTAVILAVLAVAMIGSSLRLRHHLRKRAVVVPPSVPEKVAPPPQFSRPPAPPRASVRSAPRKVTPARRPRNTPRNPSLPRVACPKCNKMITLTKAGAFRHHGPQYGPCSGSGKKYVEYVIHEEPV